MANIHRFKFTFIEVRKRRTTLFSHNYIHDFKAMLHSEPKIKKSMNFLDEFLSGTCALSSCLFISNVKVIL